MIQNQTDNSDKNQLVRTVFSVLVTPLLGVVTIFFLQETYKEQKDVKAQQNLILIKLGQFEAREQSMQKNFDEFKKNMEERVDSQDEKIEKISNDINNIYRK